MLATKWQGSGGVILGSCMIGRMLGRCGGWEDVMEV